MSISPGGLDRSATGNRVAVFFICAISLICTVKQYRANTIAFVRTCAKRR